MTESATATAGVVRKGDPMLAVDEIAVYYGNIAAVKGLTLRVHPGEIVTLIGSNGAGKTTTLRTISGLLKPRSGSITFNGEKINNGEGNELDKTDTCQTPG